MACELRSACWAFCDGRTYQLVLNTALYSVIGTTYGGDGEKILGVPDLRGRALVGADALPLGSQTSRIAPTTTGLPTAVAYASAWFVITTGR